MTQKQTQQKAPPELTDEAKVMELYQYSLSCLMNDERESFYEEEYFLYASIEERIAIIQGYLQGDNF